MIECSSCGLMINKNDKKCPRCGHVFDVHKKEKDILTGVGATVSGAGVIAAGVISHEKETKNTIKSIKNNALKKSTEKIENTESVKKADSKTTTRTNNQNKKQTSSTAYESKKYNDSLELSESSNSIGNSTKESQNENEHDSSEDVKTEKSKEVKLEDTKAQTNTTTSSKKSTDDSYTQSEGITQEELVNLLERLEEEQGNDENIKTILKEFSENHKGDESLEELLKALMGDQGNFDDINEMNLEDEDELKSTADSSDMGGDGINISFYSLEQALALLGESSLAAGGVTNITSCPGYDKSGGLERVFEKLESGNFTRIKEETSTFDNYRETIKGFFGENGSGGFVDNLRSSLVGLREKLKAMYTEAEYLEAYNSEMNYRFYDEYGHLDVEKALELYNSLHIDDRKSRWDLSTMSDEEYTSFYNYFSSDERVQNYFSNVEKNILNGVESIESKAFTSTDFYLRNKENGVILTEEEVKNHYKDFGDRIAASLYTGLLGLGLIDLNSGYDGNKTYEDFINNRVTDGLTGYDTDADGNKTGEEKADYNGKSDAQKQLEILTYSWYAKDNSHYDSEQYKILTAYVDRYCEEKNIDKIDLPTNDHLYQLLQAGASNALWDEDGNFRTRTYFDEETGEMSEQEKIIQRYERAITGGYNENGELDNHRDSEWRINRTTFEESFILSNNYVRKSDALTEATKNHSELFKVDDETKEIIYDDDKKTSEYDENEKELYEIAKKASEEYKEALDAMNLFGFFVNQSQIDEAKKEVGENYSKDNYPAGVKEYLEYMNSENKNPYQYMAKYDADNYSDAVEKFGDSMGSKVPHVIEIFSEMPSVKEGRITAEELAKNLSNSLSTNADYYHMYLESVESQHITNVTGILSLAKTRSENYKGIYNVDQQTIQYLEGFGTPEEKEEAIEKSDKDYEKWQNEEQLGKELAQEIGDSQAKLSTIGRDIETVQYNKIMAKLPSERTEEEKDFCMRYRIERTGTEQKEFIAQLNDYYEKLSNCENINEATQLLNYISMINENKLCNLEQVFEGKKLRLNEDFEEASKSIIARVEYTYEYDKDGVYGRVTYMYDSEGNKIEASEEEYELYLADLARKNGGELPFYYKTQISCELLEKINCLANNDTGLLTYKYHREDSETFKMDYKNYFQYGALVEATKEYEEYLAKLEKRGDFGDWITTVGYGARAGFEQFADGFKSFMNPDGIKSISEYRSMLISSYLIETYGSDALNSNFMLGTYEISTSMANMLPSVALSMIPGVGQYLSLSAMFISSAGNSMEQAYQSGYTLEQSYIIGLISGALETGLQATVGGITKLKIKGRNPLGFLNVGDKLLSKMTEGTFRYALTNYGFNILSEGLEEGSQEFLGAFLENRVKYGFDYRNNFQEWKDTLNDMSLEEWQESKFIEWKSDNLSNNTGTSSFFTIKNMTFEEWLKGCKNGEINDLEGNALKVDLSEFNRLKSSDYTAKEWYEDNKSKTDVQSILKSALYGAISGGIFEGATQFAPEVISYTRTGTTLGMNAIMNAVRNQSAASGTPKNIFQIMAETNQIIKEQSKTGKMSDLVEQYIKSPSFQSEYDSFINDIEQSRNETESSNKLLKSIKSIKESLFGPEENISEVQFATMKVADNLARTSLKNRLIESLDSTTYQSYQELLDARDRITRSEELIKNELEGLKSNENGNSTIESLELSESLLSELIKEREDSLKALAERKAGLDQAIKMKERLTEDLRLELSEELINIIENINSNESTVAELEQLLSETTNSNNDNSNSKAIEELENRIDGKTKELNNKKAKNEITKKQIEIKTKEIEQLQEQLKSLKENTKKGKEQETQKINETINKLKENIESNKARMNEIESITEIIANPKFELSSLTTEQFNNFISNLDYNSLKVYAKDIVSRLSDLSDTRISELIERLDPITLGVFENQVVERVKHITEEEVLNNIKDKNASKFTQNIYEIEVSTDTTTNTTETVSENTVETEPSTNTRNNNSTETVIRETVKPENETSRTEAKKELVSQNAALGTVGLIQMGALTGGLKGNQTLNNVLETIQTDINSLKQRNDSTTINGEVNVETEVNVNEETNSNINVREELKAQIDQKTKLYNDLTQLMIKYGVDGSELLTTLKEKIVSGKYELEQQLLNTATNIEETITDSITESEAAIKEIMQQFDLTKADQTTLNEARTAAMYKILEIANKNNISVDSILSKINIDEMLAKNDVQSELEIAANRLNGIVEETDNLTEEDFKFLESEDAQGAEDYIVLMKAINNIRNLRFNTEDAQVIEEIYNRIKNQSPEFVRKDKMKCVTLYIAKLKMKMYKNNLLGTVNIKDGTKTIKVNMYGKDISSNLLINSLNEINKLLKETPSFMKETITEINLFDFDCDLDLFFALKYYNNIAKPYQASASSNGSEISFWKLGLSQLISEIPSEHAQGVRTLNHEIGHNIDKKLGECELSQDYWTFKNQLWNEAIERDGGRNYAPTEYAKTTLQEDFAESIAEYMSDPSYFTEKFPNRAKILQNIFKAYTKEIDCSYDKAAKRVNKHRLKEKLLYEKEIFECRKVLDKMVKKTDLNNTRPDVLKSIQELLYGQALDIAQKYNMSIEEVLERINYYKIFPKNNITVPEIITIAPLGRNALDFDNNINGNTNNNGETRNTTEGVKTIKSLDQIIDEDIRSKLVEAIEKNQESSKKFKEGKISGAIAALSWDEINEILKSSPNSKVVNELCKVWSTNAISPSMLMFNYEQTIEIVNELKKGISIETLMELDIDGFLKGEKTIGELYIDRAYAIIKEALIKEARKDKDFSDVKIGIEFARMIIKGNQQVIEYKEDSKYQNNFIKNLTKFSPKQLQEINNLFNVISGFEVCESEDDYKGKIAGKAGFGGKILDHIYKINEIYEEEVIKNGKEANKINLNIEIINGLLKLAPKLSSLSDCNSMISSLISGYFYHDGKYLFNNQKYYTDLISAIQKSIDVSRKKSELVSKIIGIIKNPKTTDVVSEVIFAIKTKLETESDLNLDKKDKSGKKTNEFVKRIEKIMKNYKKGSDNVELISSLVTEIEKSLGTDTIVLKEIMDKTNSLMSEIKSAIKNTENRNSIEFISKIEEIIKKSLPKSEKLSLKISKIIKSTTDMTDLLTKVSNEISASLKSDYIKSIEVEMNELNSYAEEILSTLLHKTVNEKVLRKIIIINVDKGKVEINSDFVKKIKNKLTAYETRIVYNYLEGKAKSALNIDQQVKIFEDIVSIDIRIKEVLETGNITKADAKTKIKEILKSIPNNETLISNIESIIDNSLSIKDTLLKIVGEVQTTMGYTTTTAIISKKAELASRFRNVLRESMQDAGFGISVLPKAGTNKLNSTYAGAIINYLMKYKFDGLDNSLKYQIIEIMGTYPGGEDLSTYSSKEILKWLENLPTENINDIYNDLLKEQLSETILRSKIGIYDNAFKSNDFVNIAVGITNMNKAQFLEKIKSWEEKLATNDKNLKGYNLLGRYNYFKYITEKIGESIEKFKTIINWHGFGGYKDLPHLFENFFTNTEGEFIISRYGSEKSNNITIGRPGEEIPGTDARGIPVKEGIYYTAKIDLAKYKKLCDLMLNSLNDLNILNETNISELLNYINTPKNKRTSIEKNVDIEGFVTEFNKLIRENSNVVELLRMITNNEQLTAESISSKISDISKIDIKNMTNEDIDNLKVNLYEINLLMKYFSNYSYSKYKSRTLEDFRKVSELMIERCLNTYFKEKSLSTDEKIKNIMERFAEFNIRATPETEIEIKKQIDAYLKSPIPGIIKELTKKIAKDNDVETKIESCLNTYFQDTTLSYNGKIAKIKERFKELNITKYSDAQIEGYLQSKDSRIIKEIVKATEEVDIKYGIAGYVESFEDLKGGAQQTTLMFSFADLEACGIIKEKWYDFIKMENASYEATRTAREKLKTSFENTMNNETNKSLAKAIEYVGTLTIDEVNWLIINKDLLQLSEESGKFMKTAMQIYQQGLEAASTKYKEFYQNFRDHGFKHALEVTKYALELSKKLNMSDSEIELVAYSALAHDFGMQGGKVYIDEGLITKFAKYYIKHLGKDPKKETRKLNYIKNVFRNELTSNHETGRIWDIDGLQKYLKEKYGKFIIDKDFIMDVARSSHPLNSALDILANSGMIPKTLQENIAKEFNLKNSKNVATSLIALLAMSHSKSTSGIKLMDQSQMWLNCVDKLELSAKARGVEESLNAAALKEIIGNPELFEKLQDMAILVRDGDAMSKVVSEDGTTKTVMQNGEVAILDLSDVKGEKLFQKDGTLISAEKEHSRIKEETTIGRKLDKKDDNYSKGIHAGELNTEYSSNYTKENGKKKYAATVTVKDSSLVPHSTLDQSILERLGELNTYTNMDERSFIIYLSAETDQRIKKLYEKVIKDWINNDAMDATEAALRAIGIQPGTKEYNDIIDRQTAFYKNIQIIDK